MAAQDPTTSTKPPERAHVRSAWLVSLLSVIWTGIAGSLGVGLGFASGSGVLIAFSAVGIVDAVGSAALVHHFRHALRHDAISDDLERIAHHIVTVGLILVGCAAVAGNVVRLIVGQESRPSIAATSLAAISLVVLTILSLRKRVAARLVRSPALNTDGHLSAIGALLATVTLIGTGAVQAFGWEWADASAAIVLGCAAVVLGILNRPTSRVLTAVH